MSTRILTVSSSPHVHAGSSVSKLMYGVVIALLPAFAASLWFFGIGALIVTVTAVVSCIGFEYLINRYLLKRETSIGDGSALVTGLLLAFNLPSNLPAWIIVLGALVAVGVAKMSFGGLGNNLFNPALVGRVFLLISFPQQMTAWPVPLASRLSYIDAVTGPTALGTVKETLARGANASELLKHGVPVENGLMQVGDYMSDFFGNIGGSLGEVSAFAILLGLAYMLIRRIISWHIPVSILATVLVFTGILWIVNPAAYFPPLFHLFTGGLMLGAVFMATDYVTSPMHPRGMLFFGVGIGMLTVVIRIWGAYPEGISFAILIMNAFVPLINKGFRPRLFGKPVAEKQ